MVLKNRLGDSHAGSFDDMLEEGLETGIGDRSGEEDRPEPHSDIESPENLEKRVDSIAERFFSGKGAATSSKKTLEEKMEDIYEEFKADTTITVANIRDIAFRTAAIKGRWCSRLMAERVRSKRIKETLDAVVEELGKIVDGTVGPTSYLGARQSRENIVNQNESVKALRAELYESKQLQDYLTMVNESIRDLGYVVKNSLDALNLERGL